MPPSEVGHLVRSLFDDESGRRIATRIDQRIDRLPGLNGLNLISGNIDRYAAAA